MTAAAAAAATTPATVEQARERWEARALSQPDVDPLASWRRGFDW